YSGTVTERPDGTIRRALSMEMAGDRPCAGDLAAGSPVHAPDRSRPAPWLRRWRTAGARTPARHRDGHDQAHRRRLRTGGPRVRPGAGAEMSRPTGSAHSSMSTGLLR